MRYELEKIKIIPILFILFAVIARLAPHPANFAPITALALFGAVYFPRRYAFILPIGAMLLSDFVIGFYGWTMLFVYGSFLLSGLIGLWVRRQVGVSRVLVGSLAGSLLFFLITNFGVWINPVSSYSKDFGGLIVCYVAGLPFFRNTFLGDLFYVGAFFGGYYLISMVLKKTLSSKTYQKLV